MSSNVEFRCVLPGTDITLHGHADVIWASDQGRAGLFFSKTLLRGPQASETVASPKQANRARKPSSICCRLRKSTFHLRREEELQAEVH